MKEKRARGWTRPWDGWLASRPCPGLTSTIIDLSGNGAAHILTVSALYTRHTDLPTPPSLPKPRYRCCLPSTTSVGHPRNLLRTASKHRASRLESPAPYLVFPLYTHTHTHTYPFTRWRQGRRSSSRYCSSGLDMLFIADARRSLSSETAGSARRA